MKNTGIPKSLILITIVLLLITCLLRYHSYKKDSSRYISLQDYFEQDEEKLENYTESKVYEYKYKDDKIDKASKALLHHYTYDEKGNVLTHARIKDNDENKYRWKEVNKYNKSNKLIESIEYDTNGKKKEYKIIKYLKDDTTKVEETGEIYDEELRKIIFKYDNKGNEIYCKDYTDNKIIQEVTTTYTYNKNGKPKKEIRKYYTESSLKSPETITTITYTYNGNGEIEKESVYEITYKESKKSIFTSNTTYTYNENGKLEKEIKKVYPEDGSLENHITTKTYTYDKAGNNLYSLSEQTIHNPSQDIYDSYYTYNEKGLITKEEYVFKHKNGKQNGYSFKYKYNNKGLVTKRLQCDVYGYEDNLTELTVYEYK